MEPKEQKITIWGAHGVGKSLFIQSLFRELYIYEFNPNVRFKLLHVDGDNQVDDVLTVWNKIEPTRGLYEIRYRIVVEARNQQGEAYPIAIYNIGIYDASGDELIEAVKVQGNSLIDVAIKEAVGVIALFDPKNFENVDDRQKNSESFQRLIIKLRENNNNKEIYLAACMNKMDTLNIRCDNPDVVFEMYFGSTWKKLSRNITDNNIRIKYFLTSGVGFCHSKSGTDEVSNYKFPDSLRNQEAWRPWNVSAPFFWIFNQLDSPKKPGVLEYPVQFW
jgi:GTPase SAR1 family protein